MPSTRIPVKQLDTGAQATSSLYVRAAYGRYQQLRRLIGFLFVALFLLSPWFTHQEQQAILINLTDLTFHVFSYSFWPQDLPLFALLLMIAAFGLFFMTTFYGRIWCGFLCPQTIWTFTYIWFEEKLEGSANKRRRQDSLPLTTSLIIRKILKHIAWLSIALITALTFVGFFTPIRELLSGLLTFTLSGTISFWVIFFTFCTYGNAGWMRSIMCLHICPYARFQSAMFDQHTYTVAYDADRGETRGPRRRKATPEQHQLGDCVDCQLCVQVCPTGIDIRNGLQYECIGCGACIDACNHTMEKMRYPKDLIQFTPQKKSTAPQTHLWRPKLLGYGGVLIIMIGGFVYSLATTTTMELDVIKDRGQLYTINQDNLIENAYTLKITNKTQIPQTYHLSILGLDNAQWYGKQTLSLAAEEIRSFPISLGILDTANLPAILPIQFILTNNKQGQSIEQESRFLTH